VRHVRDLMVGKI